jgi:hypothetical protein
VLSCGSPGSSPRVIKEEVVGLEELDDGCRSISSSQVIESVELFDRNCVLFDWIALDGMMTMTDGASMRLGGHD